MTATTLHISIVRSVFRKIKDAILYIFAKSFPERTPSNAGAVHIVSGNAGWCRVRSPHCTRWRMSKTKQAGLVSLSCCSRVFLLLLVWSCYTYFFTPCCCSDVGEYQCVHFVGLSRR
ncbi:hypothetical protein IQ06DRAFT_111373 [Phaeosphaeriaceae sp. SRC1lsM3a]|nr:hypothetical protein IQ06DRAFT_111373 [Stagonospora sp. SRC1lsM3a]